MHSRNRFDELKNLKNLPGGIDRFMLSGLHANTEQLFREARQNDEPMDRQVAKFNREFQKMAESSESMQELAQEVIHLDTNQYKVETHEYQDFKDFVEEKASEVYREDVLDVFGTEFIETLEDISELESNRARYRLNEVSDLEDDEYDFRNRVAAWAEHSETERVAELLASKYLSNLDDPQEQFFIMNTADKIFSASDSGYEEVLNEIDRLDPEEGREYIEGLESALEEERDGVLTIQEEQILDDLEDLVTSAHSAYQLAAETEDFIGSVMEQYPGHGGLLADTVAQIYSRPLEDL